MGDGSADDGFVCDLVEQGGRDVVVGDDGGDRIKPELFGQIAQMVGVRDELEGDGSGGEAFDEPAVDAVMGASEEGLC